MREVAEGLRHIHAEGIVHGDLCGVRILNPGSVNIYYIYASGKYIP